MSGLSGLMYVTCIVHIIVEIGPSPSLNLCHMVMINESYWH